MIIKDRNREEYLRTYKKGERDRIKELLEKAFQKKKKERGKI
jgi:hypothetical protein